MAEKEDRKAFLRDLGKYSALGLEMAASVIFGLIIGYYLDKWLGTGPWLTVLWVGIGFAAGVRSLYRTAVRYEKEQERQDEEKKRKPGGE